MLNYIDDSYEDFKLSPDTAKAVIEAREYPAIPSHAEASEAVKAYINKAVVDLADLSADYFLDPLQVAEILIMLSESESILSYISPIIQERLSNERD